MDYKSLGVRYLGSIHEGLLEFKLKIAGEDLTTKTENEGEVHPLVAGKSGQGPVAAGRTDLQHHRWKARTTSNQSFMVAGLEPAQNWPVLPAQ